MNQIQQPPQNIDFTQITRTVDEDEYDPDDYWLEDGPNAIEELRCRRQWVLYRQEDRGGKLTKVPYTAAHVRMGDSSFSQRSAATNSSATWTSYEMVQWACSLGGYAGIGFVFTHADPYCGIDLDDAFGTDGQLLPWAKAIVEMLDSYTERSPSGTGVKIFCRAMLPGKGRRFPIPANLGGGDVEMYDQGRFFTVTGLHLAGTPIELRDAQDAVDALHEELFASSAAPATAPTVVAPRGVGRDDEEILRRCRGAGNCRKFNDLWNGSLQHHDGDDSRADLSLCCLLAFYTSDPQQIERLFNQSVLGQRGKWRERKDYRDMTIAKALTLQAKPVAEVPVDVVNDDPAATTTLHPGGAAPIPIAPLFADTDTANADRLVNHAGGNLLYCSAYGKAMVFDGHWNVDNAGYEMRLAREVADSITVEARQAASPEQQERLSKWAKKSHYRPQLNAMIKLARYQIGVEPQQFDVDPWLFACANGTLDLRTGVLGPSRRDDFITKASPISFDAEAVCPTFDRFMNEIFEGKVDLIEYVDRLLGWCLTGDVRHHVLPIFWGSGRNGKNTLLELVMYVMGDHACKAADTLFGGREEHPTEIADLQGRRLAVASEVDEGVQLRTAVIKRLTGDEKIKARKMGGDFYQYIRTAKMILITNNKPQITETTKAVWDRVKVVPFNFVPQNPDPSLPGKLRKEAAGVLARLVRACQRWQQSGHDLKEPEEVKWLTRSYQQDEDPVAKFVDHCCVVGSGQVARSVLLDAYRRWAAKEGETLLGQAKLYKRLRQFDGVVDHEVSVNGQKLRMFQGLSLR